MINASVLHRITEGERKSRRGQRIFGKLTTDRERRIWSKRETERLSVSLKNFYLNFKNPVNHGFQWLISVSILFPFPLSSASTVVSRMLKKHCLTDNFRPIIFNILSQGLIVIKNRNCSYLEPLASCNHI